MNKIYCSKVASFFAILSLLILILTNILNIYLIFDMLKENNIGGSILFLISQLVIDLIFVFSILFMNRLGCVIIYDKINNVLIRKGYIFGYKDILKVEEIIRVEKATLSRDGEYYILIDNKHFKYDGGSQNSFFRIPYDQDGKTFIKQFFDLL